MARPAKKPNTKRIHILLEDDLLAEVEAVRDKEAKEKLTHQIEHGLKLHISARRRARKRKT